MTPTDTLTAGRPSTSVDGAAPDRPTGLAEQLRRWLGGPGERTLGGLVETFGEASFAVLFVVLLAVPALPVPTAGLTHVFELIAVLVAAQLVAGRREVWLPQRWHQTTLTGPRRERFVSRLTGGIARLERVSRPRAQWIFDRRAARVAFGAVTIVFTVAAFLAPPLSGLDTLPSLGVVVLALGVLLRDALVAAAGLALGLGGITLEIVLGAAAFHGISAIL